LPAGFGGKDAEGDGSRRPRSVEQREGWHDEPEEKAEADDVEIVDPAHTPLLTDGERKDEVKCSWEDEKQ